jgi:hypothetical protein
VFPLFFLSYGVFEVKLVKDERKKFGMIAEGLLYRHFRGDCNWGASAAMAGWGG